MASQRSSTIILAVLGILASIGASSPDTDTTRRGRLTLRSDTTAYSSAKGAEIPVYNPDSILISGYDKPLRSLRETFFATTHYSSAVTSLTVEMTYHNDDDMLHSRVITIPCDIPSGETRQLYTTAWDRQYTYYYHRTRITPKSKGAIAYEVKIVPLSITTRRAEPSDAP